MIGVGAATWGTPIGAAAAFAAGSVYLAECEHLAQRICHNRYCVKSEPHSLQLSWWTIVAPYCREGELYDTDDLYN